MASKPLAVVGTYAPSINTVGTYTPPVIDVVGTYQKPKK